MPWKGNKDFIIFQQILERKINFPVDMNMDAVNLIDMLMQLNPLKRLGFGESGSGFEFESLKQHPFFAGLSFEKLEKGLIRPPIPADMFKNAIEKNSEPIKNTSPDIASLFIEEQKSSQYLEESNNFSEEKMSKKKRATSKRAKNKVNVLIDGIVEKKKKGLLSSDWKGSHMILTDQPRLYLMTKFNFENPAPQKYIKDILLYPKL